MGDAIFTTGLVTTSTTLDDHVVIGLALATSSGRNHVHVGHVVGCVRVAILGTVELALAVKRIRTTREILARLLRDRRHALFFVLRAKQADFLVGRVVVWAHCAVRMRTPLMFHVDHPIRSVVFAILSDGLIGRVEGWLLGAVRMGTLLGFHVDHPFRCVVFAKQADGLVGRIVANKKVALSPLGRSEYEKRR